MVIHFVVVASQIVSVFYMRSAYSQQTPTPFGQLPFALGIYLHSFFCFYWYCAYSSEYDICQHHRNGGLTIFQFEIDCLFSVSLIGAASVTAPIM